MKKTLFAFTFLIFVGHVGFAEDLSGDMHARLSLLLYPETKNWREVNSFPVVDKNKFDMDKWIYRSVYLKTYGNELESHDCSFITRVFYESYNDNAFRIGDVNGDGVEDIIYSGGAQCREGNMTFIWEGNEKRTSNSNLISFPYLALRFETSSDNGVSSVDIGCCGDPISSYMLGDLEVPHRKNKQKANMNLEFPKGMLPARKRYKAVTELILRLSTKIDNNYDPEMSQFMYMAVFGNIEAKYYPGAEGTIVAKYTDIKGLNWGLIMMDEKSKPYLIHTPDGATVGWVQIK